MSIKPVRDEYIIAGDLTFHYVEAIAISPRPVTVFLSMLLI